MVIIIIITRLEIVGKTGIIGVAMLIIVGEINEGKIGIKTRIMVIIGTIINRGIVTKINPKENNNHNNYVVSGKNSQPAEMKLTANSDI